MKFVSDLKLAFSANSNPTFALQMKNYLVNKFELYGIKSQLRRQLLNATLANHKEELKSNLEDICRLLYNEPQRELHLCAIEIYEKEKRKTYQINDIGFIQFLITENSHWDSVDFIAKQILGKYLMKFPEQINTVINQFSNHGNLWLNRSAILFQLGYKTKIDFKLLTQICDSHKHSDEFFIKKAIGWALREYAKIEPQLVLDYVNSTQLKPLSHREAIRNII